MYKFYKLVIPLLLLSILFLREQVYAQDQPQITVKGHLIDEQTGEAAIGAVVFIKGTKFGTQTDEEGNYEITAATSLPFTLVINYTGYQSKEVEVYDTEQPVDVKLRSSATLSEVVIVGYGEQKREDLTGSVTSVPTELKKQPVSSVERLLQGAIPGATVTQTSGQPGGGVSIQIRGSNSITAGSEPLYVIDGFPIYNDYTQNDAGVTDGPKINPLASINTNDIESIDVLKDASATAIYGSRGANGVILITTKKGKFNQNSITYDGYYGVQTVTKTIPVLNAAQWWDLRKDAYHNTPGGKSPALTQGAFAYDTTGAGTDWQKAAFREAPIQSHSLSILGGSETTRYAFSGNYFKQDGILLNTGFTRFTGRLNLENDYNKKLKFTTYVSASNTNAKVAPAAIVPNLLLASPAIPLRDTTGGYVRNTSTDSPLQNPINSLVNQINTTNTTRLLGNAAAEYKIIPSLSVKILLGTDISMNKQNRFLPNSTYEGNASGGVGTGGIATVGTAFTTGWLNENTINYNKKFGKIHAINAVVGFTAQAYQTESTVASAGVFAFDDITYNNLGSGTGARQPSSNFVKSTLASYLGRINYVLSEKYLFTASFRADGSSKFGPSNKWGYFPSAAVGWNVHKEEFFKVKQISILKPRVSYGLTGNQNIPAYSSISLLQNIRYNFGGTSVAGYYPLTVSNPNLRWEKTAQFDVGLDLGLFKNRVNIVADYYYKKTSDLLLNAPVPGTSGLSYYDANNNASQASTVYQNIGVVENKGWELGLNTQNFVGKKFTWNSIFVISQNQNKILSLGGLDRIIPNISLPSVLQVGAPVGSYLVYQTDGLIQPGQDGPNALTPQANKQVGGQKYKDINGDGKITQDGDRVVIKNNPGFNYGITNTFNYKTVFGDFDLTIFFQGNKGATLYNQNRANLELGTGYVNGSTDLLNRYSATNTNTDVKAAFQDPAITISDRYIESASYLRLKNLTIGYTLPKTWTAKAKLANVRIYASLQNILTWTKYTGYDPEASIQGQSLIYKGIDNGVYPNSKTILGGISFTF